MLTPWDLVASVVDLFNRPTKTEKRKVHKIENVYRVTYADGSQEEFKAGGVKITDGLLELQTVYIGLTASSCSSFRWFAPGTWRDVEHLKNSA